MQVCRGVVGLETTINLIVMFLDCCRKQGYLERVSQWAGITFKFLAEGLKNFRLSENSRIGQEFNS